MMPVNPAAVARLESRQALGPDQPRAGPCHDEVPGNPAAAATCGDRANAPPPAKAVGATSGGETWTLCGRFTWHRTVRTVLLLARRVPDRRGVGAVLDGHGHLLRHLHLEELGIVRGPAGLRDLDHAYVVEGALLRIEGRVLPEGREQRTVDVADASYTNAIGDPLLTAHWVDPDFDPKQRAFYYVRVIEIPKPRWTAYDAKFFNVKMPKEVPMTVQDRAYTSPIWYTP